MALGPCHVSPLVALAALGLRLGDPLVTLVAVVALGLRLGDSLVTLVAPVAPALTGKAA